MSICQHWTEPQTDDLLWLVWETYNSKFGASHSQVSHIQFPHFPLQGERGYLARLLGEMCGHYVDGGRFRGFWLVNAPNRYQAIKKVRNIPALGIEAEHGTPRSAIP